VSRYKEYIDGGRLLEIHDADTLIIAWDLGAKTWIRPEKIRINGLDAPESGTLAGKAATAYTTQWFAEHCPTGVFTLRTLKIDRKKVDALPLEKQEKFGRYLGVVIAADGHCLNDDLIATGNAKPWKGRGAKPWGADD